MTKKTKTPREEKAAKPAESSTALAKATPAAEIELSQAERADVRKALAHKLDPVSDKKNAILYDFTEAARYLAPHFGVTNSFGDKGVGASMDPDLLIEVLCSAAAWLAKAGDMPREKLFESFGKWAEDQGYPPA